MSHSWTSEELNFTRILTIWFHFNFFHLEPKENDNGLLSYRRIEVIKLQDNLWNTMKIAQFVSFSLLFPLYTFFCLRNMHVCHLASAHISWKQNTMTFLCYKYVWHYNIFSSCGRHLNKWLILFIIWEPVDDAYYSISFLTLDHSSNVDWFCEQSIAWHASLIHFEYDRKDRKEVHQRAFRVLKSYLHLESIHNDETSKYVLNKMSVSRNE